MAGLKLVVVVVDMRMELWEVWMPPRAVDMLCTELAQAVCSALSSPDLPSCISSIIFEPHHALIPVAEFFTSQGLPTLITTGSDSPIDEEEVQKLQSENSSDTELHFANLTLENVEMSGGKPNVWVGKEVPTTGNLANWMVLHINSLENYDLKSIFKQFLTPVIDKEESKTDETAEKPPITTDIYAGKTPEEAKALFFSELQKDLISIPSSPLENLYDVCAMLVHFLYEMQRICKSAYSKFKEVMPFLGPTEPVDLTQLETILRSYQLLPPKVEFDAVALPQIRRLQVSITNLNESSELLSRGLQEVCEVFGRMEVTPKGLGVSMENGEVKLVNTSNGKLAGTVRYVNSEGVELMVSQEVDVEAESSVLCLGVEQYQAWKEYGLARVEIVGGSGIDV